MYAESKWFDLLDRIDVVQARQYAREMARELGFGLTDQTRIATAVSEVAQAICRRGRGRAEFSVVTRGTRRGLQCACRSDRAGDPCSPPNGEVLAGVEHLVDEFDMRGGGDEGVSIVLRKWLQCGVAVQTTVPQSAVM